MCVSAGSRVFQSCRCTLAPACALERLLALQDAAATVEDLIDLETAISDRQGQLESLEAQQRYLADQVDLSTLRLTLGSDATAPVDEPDTFLTGLIAGWEAVRDRNLAIWGLQAMDMQESRFIFLFIYFSVQTEKPFIWRCFPASTSYRLPAFRKSEKLIIIF